jgi:hypothetical protein
MSSCQRAQPQSQETIPVGLVFEGYGPRAVDIPQPPPDVVPLPPSPHPTPPPPKVPPEIIEPPLPGQAPVRDPIVPTDAAVVWLPH